MSQMLVRLAVVLGLVCSLQARTAQVPPPVRAAGLGSTVYFDESDPAVLKLGNAHYEFGFYRTNGGIAFITDKASGGQLSPGSHNQCLWGAVDSAQAYWTGACLYHKDDPDHRFSYGWSAASRTLTLRYTPSAQASDFLKATMTVTASEDHWLDLRLSLENQTERTFSLVQLPCELVLREAEIQAAILPELPGIVLRNSFFVEQRDFMATYPGYLTTFADFMHVSTVHGQLSVYALFMGGDFQQALLGFKHSWDDPANSTTLLNHQFATWLAKGHSVVLPTVRLRVGQGVTEAALAYRTENGLHQFRSAAQKLGRLYPQMVQGPAYKADCPRTGVPFNEYDEKVFARIPYPGTFHLLDYQPGGFDNNFPDFLPPDPVYGTTQDLANMMRQGQARGFLMMPYINPTWWDDESPTLRNLPAGVTVRDLAVLDFGGNPMYEYYGTNGGYVVTNYSPFVRARLDQLVADLTQQVPSDILFEDQIGARPWMFDLNPANPSPAHYIQGWLEHVRAYPDIVFMTEQGFDRLAEFEPAFHGSVMLHKRQGITEQVLGDANWDYYPLAPLLMRDKVLFFQHVCGEQTAAQSKEVLTWDLAMGFQLTYDLFVTMYGGGFDSPWIEVAGCFQKYLLSAYAGERLTAFTGTTRTDSLSTFESTEVRANWRTDQTLSYLGYTLPPQGSMARRLDGTLVGGVFTGYNGTALSPGDHYLIEQRGLDRIILRQPMGANTAITLRAPAGWKLNDPLQVGAFRRDGQFLASVPFSYTASGITFTYQGTVSGQKVDYVQVRNLGVTISDVYLPIVRKGV